MFDELKKRANRKSIVAYVIFGAITLVFIFFGYQTFNPNVAGYAARVNRTVISVAEYNEAFQRLSKFYSQIFQGQSFGEEMESRIRKTALDQLVSREIVAQGAADMGLLVPVVEIQKYIIDVPVFQEEGKFRRDYYSMFLEQRHMSAAQFERQIEKDLLIDRLRKITALGLTPPEPMVQRKLAEESQKADLDFVKISESEFNSKPSSQEVSSWLANPENLSSSQNYFEQNKPEFSSEEQIKARHILIKFDANNSQSKDVARKQIDEIHPRAVGENFEALAKEFSQDVGSKEQGGDLGYFGQGRMVPEFEKVAFSLKPGQVSEPVETQFGFHIIKVEDKKPSQVSNFDDVKTKIAEKILAETKRKTVIEELQAALSKSQSVEPLLKKHGLKWESTGEFSLDADFIPKLGAFDTLFEAVYSLKKPSEIFPKVILDAKAHYVLKLKSLKTDKERAGQSEAQVKSRLAQEYSTQFLEKWGSELETKGKVQINPALGMM
ncbi:MAG: hypothetical protein COT74_01315 [Bdellovibrionales bacterium CG10_big_fil_rev_8_21_14_0_10_45_34]|nr:MAG: hypothetical protein COT74_01315 [Bdellovibrionales bacterium CG10_big_fil_rev_8_21_14_0_10_45_34]